jgi:hypothetical protein
MGNLLRTINFIILIILPSVGFSAIALIEIVNPKPCVRNYYILKANDIILYSDTITSSEIIPYIFSDSLSFKNTFFKLNVNDSIFYSFSLSAPENFVWIKIYPYIITRSCSENKHYMKNVHQSTADSVTFISEWLERSKSIEFSFDFENKVLPFINENSILKKIYGNRIDERFINVGHFVKVKHFSLKLQQQIFNYFQRKEDDYFEFTKVFNLNY